VHAGRAGAGGAALHAGIARATAACAKHASAAVASTADADAACASAEDAGVDAACALDADAGTSRAGEAEPCADCLDPLPELLTIRVNVRELRHLLSAYGTELRLAADSIERMRGRWWQQGGNTRHENRRERRLATHRRNRNVEPK
jgi:hypothetical protein